MKRIILVLSIIILSCTSQMHAQWAVFDPGNLAQGIVDRRKNNAKKKRFNDPHITIF